MSEPSGDKALVHSEDEKDKNNPKLKGDRAAYSHRDIT